MKKCTLIMLAAAMSFAACQEVEAPLAEENVLSVSKRDKPASERSLF